MLIELCLGYPQFVLRAIGHPVTWTGRLIGALDRALNRETAGANARRAAGVAAVAILIAVVGAVAFLVQRELFRWPAGVLATALLASTLIAQRSLHRHVADVAVTLGKGDITAARVAVSHIVGRDTAVLDAADISRAAIDSLAENFSDGIVAPVLWLAIAGLPGAALYKAINTADSMIGHRTPRHAAFGWAAARPPAGVSLLDARSVPFDKLAAYDRRFFPEARDSFLASWITLPERAAMVALRDGELAGFAVMRACQAASRVGPLFADSPEIAASLVSGLAAQTGATAVAIDMPDINKPAIALAERIGLKPSFETARMYTGPDPKVDYAGLYGVTSLELG